MQTIIGILVDEKELERIKQGKPRNEKVALYNKAANSCNLTPVYVSLARMNLKARLASGYRYENGRYRPVNIRIPDVIYNRALPDSQRKIARLQELNRISYVFNGHNRLGKYGIHQLILSKFRTSLPATVPYSKSRLQAMMAQYRLLYVKPQNGSLGLGVIRLSRLADGSWQVNEPRRTSRLPFGAAVAAVHRRAGRRPYLIQEGIPLATYRGRIYDIRVTVQRGGDGDWQVAGMLGRVADRGKHVTNLARGGMVRDAESLLRHNFRQPGRIAASVRKLSLDIARHLGNHLHNLADVGLDIGVDRDGKPFFIEMNGRAQRKGYAQAGMTETLRRVYGNPIRYAQHVIRSRKRI